MRWPVAIALVAGLTTATSGCRSNPRKDLVEAELRVKDEDLRELRAELEKTEAYNQYLHRELRNSQHPIPGAAPHETSSASMIRSIALGRQTTGIDDDNIPGDEALQVVIEPRDGDNHTIKVPGIAHIQALEITTEGVKKPLSNWHVDAEAMRKAWRTGLLSTGYYLVLPWRNCPTGTKVRVIVQFVAADQRLFEADRDVVVRLMPAGLRKTGPVEEGMPPLPGFTPTLPAPLEGPTLPRPKEWQPEKRDVPTEEKKEEPAVELVIPHPIMVPIIPVSATSDPLRPLQGAVELLKPIVRED